MELEVRRTKAGGIDLAYSELGKGRPLILLMGLWGVMDLWPEKFVRRLAERSRVIAFDYRGMGFSGGSGESMSIEMLADDSAAFASSLGLERSSFLGWSMGGSVALELALRRPEVVDRLVIYAGSCGGPECTPSEPCVGEILSRPNLSYKDIVQSMFPDDWNASHPDIWEYYPHIRKKSSKEVLDAEFEAEKTWPGCYGRLDELKCRTLVVSGTEDKDVPIANALQLATRIHGAWLAQFEHAGHGLMYQFPERLADCVSAFLDDAEPEEQR